MADDADGRFMDIVVGGGIHDADGDLVLSLKLRPRGFFVAADAGESDA